MTRHPHPSDTGYVGRIVAGLPPAIDRVADGAVPVRRFLTRGWYAAAVAAYGGDPRTLVVEGDDGPAFAMPLVAIGPAPLRLAGVPGSYWPLRAPVASAAAGAGVFLAAVAALRRHVRAVRIGPVPDGDPAVDGLVAAARGAGWTAIERVVAASWILDLDPVDGPWPRGSTLRKNRFHEKHLAAHGALEWQRLGAGDWPGAFDMLAEVERLSWHGQERDAKFADTRHAAFWRVAATDAAVAARFTGALLRVDGRPAAFSFDMELGETVFAIANSYDPAFARHSPGKLLQYRNLVAQRDRGVRLVDWGAGDSGYKRTIGAVEGPPLRDWLLLAPGLPSLAGRVFARRWRGA